MNKYDDIFSSTKKNGLKPRRPPPRRIRKPITVPSWSSRRSAIVVRRLPTGACMKTTIVCEFCNQAYPPNSEHACNKCGEPEGPQNETQKLISHYRALRRAATKAVKEYGDHGDGNTFGDLMIDLARELAEGAK